MAEKRSNPVKRREDRMSRADSLASLGEFGKIVTPAERDSIRETRKPKKMFSMNPFKMIRNAMGGK